MWPVLRTACRLVKPPLGYPALQGTSPRSCTRTALTHRSNHSCSHNTLHAHVFTVSAKALASRRRHVSIQGSAAKWVSTLYRDHHHGAQAPRPASQDPDETTNGSSFPA